jgi:hypothetical protein
MTFRQASLASTFLRQFQISRQTIAKQVPKGQIKTKETQVLGNWHCLLLIASRAGPRKRPSECMNYVPSPSQIKSRRAPQMT